MSRLRVLTYNVRSLRDDVDAVAAVVAAAAPDVVAIQEAPRFLRWRSKRASLARRCGLVVGTADRTGGLALMTSLRAQVVGSSFTLLPAAPRTHQRAVATIDVAVEGTTWTIACVHFSVHGAQRLEHLPYVRQAVANPAGALVMAGDLNEDPEGPVFSELTDAYQDCFAVAGRGEGPTAPAVHPRRRIDAVLAAPEVTVESCEVLGGADVERASDHRPILAVLRR